MRTVALITAALLTLTACGGSGDSKASASAPPATASPTAPAGPAPFGKTATLIDDLGTVKATAYAYRALKSQFPPDRKGYRFYGVDVRVCVTTITDPSQKTTLSWDPWSLTFADSTTVEPVSSWSDDWFTVPLYSGFGKTVRPGGCLRGWVLFEVPPGKRPVAVTYAPGNSGPLEWKVA